MNQLGDKSAKMLEELQTGAVADLDDLRIKHGLTIDEMGRWINLKPVAEAIKRVADYRRARAELVAASARTIALQTLVKIALAGTGETARRAANDILRATGPRGSSRATGLRGPAGPSTPVPPKYPAPPVLSYEPSIPTANSAVLDKLINEALESAAPPGLAERYARLSENGHPAQPSAGETPAPPVSTG